MKIETLPAGIQNNRFLIKRTLTLSDFRSRPAIKKINALCMMSIGWPLGTSVCDTQHYANVWRYYPSYIWPSKTSFALWAAWPMGSRGIETCITSSTLNADKGTASELILRGSLNSSSTFAVTCFCILIFPEPYKGICPHSLAKTPSNQGYMTIAC